MSLSDEAVRELEPGARAFKRADGRGLCVLVKPNGAKLWRGRYRLEGREKLLSLGAFPGVTTDEARTAWTAARAAVAEGRDPSREKRFATAERVRRQRVDALESELEAIDDLETAALVRLRELSSRVSAAIEELQRKRARGKRGETRGRRAQMKTPPA